MNVTRTNFLRIVAFFFLAITEAPAYEAQCFSLVECDTNIFNMSNLILDDYSANFSNQNLTCNFSGVFVVPIVVHVVHSGEPVGEGSNISEETIIAQIELLNQHFRKVNVPTELYPDIAADVGIEFQFARSNPNGLPHNGINRVNWTSVQPPYNKDYINSTIKPATIWNPNQYLNIWLISISDVGGFATFPENSGLFGQSLVMNEFLGDENTEGVVVNYALVNNWALYGSALTHEIGHYLGLLHTFQGDNSDPFGIPNLEVNCTSLFGDYCSDTPKTSGHSESTLCGDNYTCTATRDMVENFMDYSITCHQIFTNNQKTRMTVALNSPRRPDHLSYNTPEWYGLDTYEPNGSSNSASALVPSLGNQIIDTTLFSYIFHQQDYDWFKLILEGQGTLTISLENLSENFDLELYGQNGLSDWLDGSYNLELSSEQIVYQNTSTETIILFSSIFSSNHLSDKCQPYGLHIQWTPNIGCVPVLYSIEQTDASSGGISDGSAIVSVFQGTPPFEFSWSTGETSPSLLNLPSGTYQVSVSGDDGCSNESTIYIGVDGISAPTCFGVSTLTATNGSFSVGSYESFYSNNSDCSWRINPQSQNNSIILWFSEFQLASGDSVIVYDGPDTEGPVLGTYTGNDVPPQIVSNEPSIFVNFKSDYSDSLSGFVANYASQILEAGKSIVQYQFWFDEDFASSQQFSISPVRIFELELDFSTLELSNGLHTLHIRFKDDSNIWSSVNSSYFIKYPGNNNSFNSIVAGEYWFNNDSDVRIQLPTNGQQAVLFLTELDVSQLDRGLNILNIRFLDSGGNFSSTLSSHFIKYGSSISDDTFITAFRYWFDDNFQDITFILISNPSQTVNVIQEVTLPNFANGVHEIHFQYKDSKGEWSSVTSDSFTHEGSLAAIFVANNTTLCSNETVFFENQSQNAESFLWSFGDGTYSSLENPTHAYTLPGLYTVELIAYSSQLNIADTLEIINFILVEDVHIQLVENVQICPQNSATLTASGAESYFWYPSEGLNLNDNATVSASPSISTTYFVVGTGQNGCTDTSSVTVTVSDVVSINILFEDSICLGDSNILIASGAETYSWQASGGLEPLEGDLVIVQPQVTTSYDIVGFSSCGSDSTSIEIVVLPLPNASISSENNICPGIPINLYASGGTSFLWDNGEETNTIEVSPSQNTTYNVTVFDENNCSSNASVVINVLEHTEVVLDSLGTVCQDSEAILLYGGTPLGGTYSGIGVFENVFYPSQVSIGVHPITYTFVDDNNCSISSTNFINVDLCSGIESVIDNTHFECFPNPTEGHVNLLFSSSETTKAEVNIFDSNGKLLSAENYSIGNQLRIKIDLRNFADGIYHFHIRIGESIYSESIIFQR